MGIFGSWTIAATIGFITAILLLMHRKEYRPKFSIDWSVLKKIFRFSAGNYVSRIFAELPIMILPIIITNALGAEITAYYYIAFMIANMLFIIPQATAQSLFAEGSANEKEVRTHVKKAVKVIALLLVPAAIVVVFFGNWLLFIFGEQYSQEGFRFLQILGVSCIFVASNAVFDGLLKVQKRIGTMIAITLIESVAVIGLTISLLSMGLLGVGIAWIGGVACVTIAYLILYWINPHMYWTEGRSRS